MKAAVVAVVLASFAPFAARAHHAYRVAYDFSKTETLQGEVVRLALVNPHAQVAFDVTTESGDVQHWTGAVTAPNKLARAGWTKSTLKPGDEVEITGRPGRNGAHAMHIMRIVMADGHALQMREQLDGTTLP